MSNSLKVGALLSLCLLVTACDKKATGQAVAVVNGEEITLGELNAALATANVPASVDRQAVRAQVLQGLIDRRLLAQQAKQQGVDKSPVFLTRQRQLTEQLLIGLNAERQGSAAKLPDQRAVDAFIASHPGMFDGREVWTLRQIQFDTPTTPGTMAQVRSARTMDQLEVALTSARIPFQRGQSKIDTAGLPQEVLQQLNKLPADEPFVVPQGGKMVASVIVSRQANKTAPEQSRQLALQALRKQESEARLRNAVKQLRASAKIDYQEGFAPKPGPTPSGAQS